MNITEKYNHLHTRDLLLVVLEKIEKLEANQSMQAHQVSDTSTSTVDKISIKGIKDKFGAGRTKVMGLVTSGHLKNKAAAGKRKYLFSLEECERLHTMGLL